MTLADRARVYWNYNALEYPGTAEFHLRIFASSELEAVAQELEKEGHKLAADMVRERKQ